LPTSYEAQVAELSGVAETTSTLFLLSACSRATDLVAVHGIEPEKFRRFRNIDIPEEQYRAFSQERGASIVGENAARANGWRIGQAVTLQKLGNISFTIRGIFRARGSSLENAILVDLGYLQFATNQAGKMTLLLVKIAGPARAGLVAERIDALFSSSASPTKTTPERSFIASAISGVTGIVEFSRWLGYVTLGIILVGVGHSLAMTIRDRTREFAILKTLGFRRPQVLKPRNSLCSRWPRRIRPNPLRNRASSAAFLFPTKEQMNRSNPFQDCRDQQTLHSPDSNPRPTPPWHRHSREIGCLSPGDRQKALLHCPD
jgi:putative ABC transport system permease protein